MPALATLRTPDRSCAVRDVEPGLTVFACALAGSSGLPTSRDMACGLPERVERFDDYADNRSWYVVAFAHRALHQAAGTFDLDWSVPPTLFDPLTPTLPTPAGAADLWGFFALFAERDLAVDLFTLLEDLRVDQLLARPFPGWRGPYGGCAPTHSRTCLPAGIWEGAGHKLGDVAIEARPKMYDWLASRLAG